MGGVAPVVMRLRQTEKWLQGREFTLSNMRKAGQKAQEEISPISDVRASRGYRLQLAANIFEKFYYESDQQSATEPV